MANSASGGGVWGGPIGCRFFSLRVHGPTVDPEVVSEALDCDPSFERRVGDVVSSVSQSRSRIGMWKVRSEVPVGASLDEHMADLISCFPQGPEVWRGLAASGARLDIYCSLNMTRQGQGGGLSAASLQWLAERGISFEFSVTALEDEVSSGDDTGEPDGG